MIALPPPKKKEKRNDELFTMQETRFHPQTKLCWLLVVPKRIHGNDFSYAFAVFRLRKCNCDWQDVQLQVETLTKDLLKKHFFLCLLLTIETHQNSQAPPPWSTLGTKVSKTQMTVGRSLKHFVFFNEPSQLSLFSEVKNSEPSNWQKNFFLVWNSQPRKKSRVCRTHLQ